MNAPCGLRSAVDSPCRDRNHGDCRNVRESALQDHRYSFEIDATPEELWRLFWGRKKGDVLEHGDVRIEILQLP